MKSMAIKQEYLRQLLTDSSIYVNCCNCAHNSDSIKKDDVCLACVSRSQFKPSRMAEAEIEKIINNNVIYG